jgi:hypothetical protein
VIDFVKDKELPGKSPYEEKPNGMQEVVGSIPSGSTIFPIGHHCPLAGGISCSGVHSVFNRSG